MKIAKFVKANYFANPEDWGYRLNYPWSVWEIWNKVLKHTEFDTCDDIYLMDDCESYTCMYKTVARENLSDWYDITKLEYIK